jgi:hypothetical protein
MASADGAGRRLSARWCSRNKVSPRSRADAAWARESLARRVTAVEFQRRAASQPRSSGPLQRAPTTQRHSTVSPRLRRCTGFAPPLADPSKVHISHRLAADAAKPDPHTGRLSLAAPSPPALFLRGCPRRSPPLSPLQHGNSTDWCFGGLFRNHAPRFRPAPLALGSPLNTIYSSLHSPLCRPRSSLFRRSRSPSTQPSPGVFLSIDHDTPLLLI